MEQRRLGPDRAGVSRLALGTMTWGRDTDEHEAADQLMAFLEAGGTLVDTAAGYGDGESERVIGGLLGVGGRPRRGGPRHQGRHLPAYRRTGRGHLARALLDALDGSLRRLGTDHVDLWQVHAWSDDTALEETLAALDHAVATGRARYAGISNYSGWQTGRAATWQQAVAGPGAAGLDPGGVLAAAARHRARGAAGRGGARPRACCRGRRWAPACSPASTAPARPRTPGRRRRTSRASSSATSTSAAGGIVDAVCTAADGLERQPARGRAGLGARPPGVTAPIVGARTAAQLRARSTPSG